MARTEKEIIVEIEQTQAQLRNLFSELEQVKQKSRKFNHNNYEKRKELLEEASKVFEKTLKPGDFVKVTGTRTSPFREVKEILHGTFDMRGRWIPGTLVSSVCKYNQRTKSFNFAHHEIISCGTNKIVAIFRDGKWITAKEILS